MFNRFQSVLRSTACLFVAALCCATSWATTLEQLSMTDMIQQSTAIVRAKVTGSYAADRKGQIYTFYSLQILENLKSTTSASTDVAVPGGSLGGVHQLVPGSPQFTAGQEYVLFLWTSKSGLTQVIGLSQGVFNVSTDTSGNPVLAQDPAGKVTVNSSNSAGDAPSGLTLPQLRGRVQRLLGSTK